MAVVGFFPVCVLLLACPDTHNTALGGNHMQAATCQLGRAVPVQVMHHDLTPVNAGVNYESKLQASLAEAGLAFWSEEELRSQGFVKTPDARLQVPPIAACATHSVMYV